MEQRLEVPRLHGFSCPAGMWNILRPGIEPGSPELAAGLLTTEPPSPVFLKYCNQTWRQVWKWGPQSFPSSPSVVL